MKKIVIAFDSSSHSIAAVEEAKKIKVGFPKIEIIILSVTEISTARDQALNLSDDAETRKQNRIRKINKALSGLLNENEYSIELLYGDPATEILHYVKHHTIDMLIIGSRGLNMIQEFVMGSVSHKVVKYSTAPVLIVK